MRLHIFPKCLPPRQAFFTKNCKSEIKKRRGIPRLSFLFQVLLIRTYTLRSLCRQSRGACRCSRRCSTILQHCHTEGLGNLADATSRYTQCLYFGFSNSIVARFENKRKEGCKLSQVLKPPSTSPGHFSDRTFFATLVVTRFSSLLSVINIYSLIVCLQVTLLSFILLLCSGKLPLRRAAKISVYSKNHGLSQ